MSNIGCLMSGISLLLNLGVKYRQINEDPERKANTAYFGIYSIVTAIVTGGLFVLCVWGVLALMNGIDDAGLSEILMWVFVALLVILTLFLLAQYIFGGLLGVVYQFRCNHRPIAWIALVVFILTTAAMIVGVIFVLNATGIQL